MAVVAASWYQGTCWTSPGNTLLRRDPFSRERMSGEASCSSSADVLPSNSGRWWQSGREHVADNPCTWMQPASPQAPLSANVKSMAAKPAKSRQLVIRKYATGDDIGDPVRVQGDLFRERALVASAVAPLRGAYVTEAEVGLVECGPRGCRPVYDSPGCLPLSDDWEGQDMECREEWEDHDEGADLEMRMDAYHRRDVERRLQRGLGVQQFESEFAQFLDEVWMERDAAEKYFETALMRNPCDPRLLASFAQFTWRTMGNPVRAEGLYKQALAESPDSAEVLAAYALFLWQSEAEGLGS